MGRPHSRAGKGVCIGFLQNALSYKGKKCLIWPYGRTIWGYGLFRHENKQQYAHRWICSQVNGPAPTTAHQASHSCGRGQFGCVNPHHISWKTPSENAQEKSSRGVHYGGGKKLTATKVRKIRSLQETKTQIQIACQFGISPALVRKIFTKEIWRKI